MELIEKAFVGSIINNNVLIKQTSVTSDMFTFKPLSKIWELISNSIQSGKPVDIFSLEDDLAKIGLSRLNDIVMQCAQSGFSDVMGIEYGQRIVEKYRTRQIIRIGFELQQNPENHLELVGELLQINSVEKKHDLGMKEVIIETIDYIERQMESDGIIGISSGLSELDNKFGGFHPSDLIILAGRPAMGKTAMMLNMAIAADTSIGIFSAEMGKTQIGSRMLSIHSKVSLSKFRSGKFDENDFSFIIDSGNRLSKSKIRINDRPAPTIDQIIHQARKWKLEHDVKILYFDYLQRISFKGNSPRHEQVGAAAKMFKELARELDIPVVVLAQVNRDADGRMPSMANLAQSGEIEAEADQIMFIHRPEVFDDDPRLKGIAEIGIVKNRHGEIGIVKCAWIGHLTTFGDLSFANYD